MIRLCDVTDAEAMYRVINAAATAYAGVIPADCYHEQRHGFRLLPDKDTLLQTYWNIPARQVATSVVLGLDIPEAENWGEQDATAL